MTRAHLSWIFHYYPNLICTYVLYFSICFPKAKAGASNSIETRLQDSPAEVQEGSALLGCLLGERRDRRRQIILFPLELFSLFCLIVHTDHKACHMIITSNMNMSWYAEKSTAIRKTKSIILTNSSVSFIFTSNYFFARCIFAVLLSRRSAMLILSWPALLYAYTA